MYYNSSVWYLIHVNQYFRKLIKFKATKQCCTSELQCSFSKEKGVVGFQTAKEPWKEGVNQPERFLSFGDWFMWWFLVLALDFYVTSTALFDRHRMVSQPCKHWSLLNHLQNYKLYADFLWTFLQENIMHCFSQIN